MKSFPVARLYWFAAFVCLLIPSASLAWRFRDMPQLGIYHDDALYQVSAQSLAQGAGYHILSLPGAPFQTKYPPAEPWWIALPLMAGFGEVAFCWVWMPLFLGLAVLIWRQFEFDGNRVLLLCAVLAIQPIAALLSVLPMAELMSCTCVLAAIVLAERENALAAGLMAGAAFLARTGNLPLLGTAPLVYLLKRQPRKALTFGAAMFPFVAGWQIWSKMHTSGDSGLVSLYYTNYLGLRFRYVTISDLPVLLWRNADAFLTGGGKLFFFETTGSLWLKELAWIVAIAAIAGAVRVTLRSRRWHYGAFAVAFSALLLVWHYPPDSRFALPIFPLLAAGLVAQFGGIAVSIGVAWKKGLVDKVAAAGVTMFLAAFAVFAVVSSLNGVFVFLPELLDARRPMLTARAPAYQWISQNTPVDAVVFAYDDPLVFLNAGRKAVGMPIPPPLIYYPSDEATRAFVGQFPALARENGVSYVVLTPEDFGRDLHEVGMTTLHELVRRDSFATEVFRSPGATVYAVKRP